VRLCGTNQVLALSLILAGLAGSACGSTHRTTTTVPAPHRAQPSTPPSGPSGEATKTRHAATPPKPRHAATRPKPPPSLPRVGASQRVPAPGTVLVVTIRSVIDPLRDSGAQVPPGTKAIGVLVAVRNAGPGGYDSSATGDFSLDSASGQAAPLFVPSGQCKTPLQDFMNAIGAGELRTGCVAFTIPTAQQPTTVGFAPGGGSGGRRRLWAAG
jgi:hypothetical protein